MKIQQRASCGYDMGDIQMTVDERYRILGTDYRVRIDDRELGARVRDLFGGFVEGPQEPLEQPTRFSWRLFRTAHSVS